MAPYSLPNETILNILSYIHPQDIENFALVCRTFYHLSKQVLEDHRHRKRKYERVDDRDPLTIPFIVCHSYPYLAWYVRHLVVYRDRRSFHHWEENGQDIDPNDLRFKDYYSRDKLEAIRNIVRSSKFAADEDSIIEEVAHGREWPLKLLLLERAPKTRAITFVNHADWFEREGTEDLFLTHLSETIRMNAVQSTAIESGPRDCFLAQLSALNLNCYLDSDRNVPQYCVNIKTLIAFLHLPSLRSLVIGFGHRAHPPIRPDTFALPTTRSSPVTHLDAGKAIFRDNELSSVFESIRALKSFRFAEAKWSDLSPVLTLLLQHQKDSLEVLRLNLVSSASAMSTSLYLFPNLKILALDIAHLYDKKYDRDSHNINDKFNPIIWLQLRKIIPPSLQTLRIGNKQEYSEPLPWEGFLNTMLEWVRTSVSDVAQQRLKGICLSSIRTNGTDQRGEEWRFDWAQYRQMDRLKLLCNDSEVVLNLVSQGDECVVCEEPPTVLGEGLDAKIPRCYY